MLIRMRSVFRLGVLIAFANALGQGCFSQIIAPPNSLSPEEKRAGWVLLFDGHSTSGWRSPSSDRFPTDYWTVEDGFLKGLAPRNRTTDLMTTGVYRNFELRFEWKISPGGNSGVKYFVGSSQKLVFENEKPPAIEGTVAPGPNAFFMESTSGFEYQIIDDERHPDKDDSKTRSGSLYQFVGQGQILTKPAGQLNQSRIVVNGAHIEHWLNGVRVAAIDLDSAEFKDAAAKAPARSRRVVEYLNRDCPIALQSHTEAVWFRNMKLRRISAAR